MCPPHLSAFPLRKQKSSQLPTSFCWHSRQKVAESRDIVLPSPLLLWIVTSRTLVSSEGWICLMIANFQQLLGWVESNSTTKSPSANWVCSTCHFLVFLSSNKVLSYKTDQNWSKSSQILCHLWECEVTFSVVTLPLRFTKRNWFGVRMRSPSVSDSLLSVLLFTILKDPLQDVTKGTAA